MRKNLNRSGRLLCLGAVPLLMMSGASAIPATSMINHGPMVPVGGSLSKSSNWSGYASTVGGFTSVSASWVQPTGHCTSQTTYSSFWVGLDGDGSGTVEQTGSEVDCSGGTPRYYAWYEMYPAYPVNFSSTVRPGDLFNAKVSASGTSFTLTLTDATRGWTHTEHKTLASAKKHSAEIIAEAPSSLSGVLPLTDFGTISFTKAMANGKPIGNFSPAEIEMASGTTVKALPSALSSGENFTDTWHHS